MRPQLYANEASPSATAIVLTARALQLSLEIKQAPDECHKSNLHATAILKDNGHVMWDTYAIMAFLIGKYGKDDELYPRKPHVRALIDEILLFDAGVLSFFTTVLGTNGQCGENKEKINGIYRIVEGFFDEECEWVAGERLTIADFTLLPSITALALVVPINAAEYPKLVRWIARAEVCAFYEPNREALDKLKRKIAIC